MPLGVIGSIAQLLNVKKANRSLEKVLSLDPTYTENPLPAQRLALARTLFNARTPGAAATERNIYANSSNAYARAQGSATDSSQVLAAAGDIQGKTNQAFNQLGIDEAQDYQRRYNNVAGAEEGLINEQDKVFNDKVRKFGDYAQIKGAEQENKTNLLNSALNEADSLATMGFSLGDFGLSGSQRYGSTSAPSYMTNPAATWQRIRSMRGDVWINPYEASASYPTFTPPYRGYR